LNSITLNVKKMETSIKRIEISKFLYAAILVVVYTISIVV